VIAGDAITTPLVRLPVESGTEIWLKLECLQPIGSFKIRGAASAIRQAGREAWAEGVWTTSAGNMAQGVAWVARDLGVPCTVVAPEHAPAAKLEAIERLGGTTILVPYETWWESMSTGTFPGLNGLFVHPVMDERVMAGNGTIALELVEQLDGFDTVLVPWGGGGLATGIASGLRGLGAPARVVACEPETGAALGAALAAGRPVEVPYTASFVDGAGSKTLLGPMWERSRGLVDEAVSVSLDDAAEAVRLLATRVHVVAEGAGALAVAAALAGGEGASRVVCIVSGGNIDPGRLASILCGHTPD
jgi:threonine dehydratase